MSEKIITGKYMKKTAVFYTINLSLYFSGIALLLKMYAQPISTRIEAIMVLLPIIINLFIIGYSLYFSRVPKNFNGIVKILLFLFFYIIVLITFCISVFITLLLYFGISPKLERFLF